MRLAISAIVVLAAVSACGGNDGSNSFTIGGSITGLTGSGLVLDDGTSTVSPAANGTTFTFSTREPTGTSYSVTVGTQPVGQRCSVSNGSGTVSSANITSVHVSCITLYSVGGTINGLTSPGLVLGNGADTYSPAANATSFSMPNALAPGVTYDVTIKTQPSGQTCEVSNGSGTVGAVAITTVRVSCPSPWVWVRGSSFANAGGVYGMLGVAASGNVPGARSGVASWIDAAGNLWLFGGEAPTGELNDLWKFTPNTGLWAWEGGSNTPNTVGVYGTLGVASAANVPGSRQGAASWTDGAGAFWLFGGDGYDSTGFFGNLNDLWRYSPSAGTWTWISGANTADSLGVSGTRGVAAPGNTPSARAEVAAVVTPAGEFWIFGGFVAAEIQRATSDAAADDLWKYSPGTGLWTWVTPNSFNLDPVYGTRGVAAAGNDPGARRGPAGWSDAKGDVWVFGGGPAPHMGLYIYNSLFKFDPAVNMWTWVSGSNAPNASGVYGSEGTPAPGNVPGSRFDAASWTDAFGNFWLFGGDGRPPNIDLAPFQHNDLWTYNPSTGEWTWISGANTDDASPAGQYGTQGAAAPGNVPAGRARPASWIDTAGQVWIFGGDQGRQEFFNDLWTFRH